MADTKTYNVIYNIEAITDNATTHLKNLATISQQLNKSTGITKFNAQVRQLASYAERLNSAINAFTPRLDMRTFQSQLRIMEKAVATTAANIQNMMSAALSGNSTGLQKAMSKKGGWVEPLRNGMMQSQKDLKKSLDLAEKEYDKLFRRVQSGYATDVAGGKNRVALSAQDIKNDRQRMRVLKSQIDSYKNGLASLESQLTSLTSTSVQNKLKGIATPPNAAESAKQLRDMSNALNKWNKETAKLNGAPKTITLKLRAIDNTTTAINSVKGKLEQLRSLASSIFIGGGGAGPSATTKGTTKPQNVKRPAGVLSKAQLEELDKVKDAAKRFVITKASGTWSKAYQEQYNALAPALSQATGLPADTDMKEMVKAMNLKSKAEWEKYNKWRASLGKTQAPKSKPAKTGNVVAPTAIPLESQIDNMIKTAATLQSVADKNGIRVGAKLDRSGILARAKSGHETIQKLAGSRPITLRAILNANDTGFVLNQVLKNLQTLANSRPITLRAIFNANDTGFALNQALTNLQKLANTRPVLLKSSFTGGNANTGINKTFSNLQNMANQNTIKLTGWITKVVDKLSARPSIRVKGKITTTSVNLKNPPSIALKAKITPTWGSAAGKAQELKKINEKIPPLKLQLDTEAAKAKFKEFVNYVRSNSKVKVTLLTDGKKSGTTTASTSIGSPMGTRRNPVVVRNEADGNAFRRWAYPLTGNASFGARTPAAVEMMKGMGVMFAIGGAMGGISSSFSQAVDYQNLMTTTKAILKNNYSGRNFLGDFAEMEKAIRREGIETKFTAPEEAGAAKFLAMAGMDIDTIKNAIRPVTNVALAGDLDLATTADKMTNIMTAFKLRTPQDFTHTADILANTFTRSNTSMMQLAESAQYAAPIASARGMGLEEMMALVGVMGDAGIQGSMAGTSLRMMMNNIFNPSKSQQKMWDELSKLGVTRKDANGNWLNVTTILDQIASKVPEKDLADVMGKLFRVTSVAGATQLAKNMTKVKQLAESNANSTGVAESLRQPRISNVQGRWAQLSSQFTEDVLRIFERPEWQEKIIAIIDKFKNVLAKPETIKALESGMDLLLYLGEMVGDFARMFLSIYNMAPGVFKAVLKLQMLFTAIGSYVLTPIIQLANMFNMFNMFNLFRGMGGAGAVTTSVAAKAAASKTGGTLLLSGALGNWGNSATQRSVVPNAVTSSVLAGGSIKGGKFARVYAERASQYRAAAARQQGIINGMLTGMTMSQFANGETRSGLWGRPDTNMNNLRELRAGKAKYNSMATQYGLLAMQADMINRQRNARQVGNADLIVRAARQGKLSGSNFKMATKAAFNTGMTAAVSMGWMKSLGASIRGGLTSVVLNLSKTLGMLASPIGLATMAIGGFTAAAIYAMNKIKKGKEEGKESADTMSAKFEESKDKNPNYKPGFDIPRPKLYISSTAKPEKQRRTNTKYKGYLNPQLENYSGYTQLYRDISFGGRGEWGDRIFNEIISPYQKYVFSDILNTDNHFARDGKISLNEFHALATGGDARGGYNVNSLRKYAEKAAIYKVVENNPEFIKAQNEIIKLSNDWSKLPKDEREAKRGEFMESVRAIQNRFTDMSGLDISGKSLKNMRVFDIYNSQQGQMAAYQLLDDFLYNDNGQFRRNFNVHNVQTSSFLGGRWLESMDSIMSNIKLYVGDGERQAEVLAKFNGMTLDFANLTEQLDKLHINFGNSVQDHLGVITQIVTGMMNIPGLKEVINNFGGVQQLIDFLLQQTVAYKKWAIENGFNNLITGNMHDIATGNVKVPWKPGDNYFKNYFNEIDRMQKEDDTNKAVNTYLKRPTGNILDDIAKPLDQNAFKNPYSTGYSQSQPKIFGNNGPLASITINEAQSGERTKEMVMDCLSEALNMMSEEYT